MSVLSFLLIRDLCDLFEILNLDDVEPIPDGTEIINLFFLRKP